MELVYQLNERALTLLADAAKSRTSEWLAGTSRRALWSELEIEAIQRAARFPFVILDVHFMDDEWWKAASARPEDLADTPIGPTCWPRNVAQQLMNETLVFAWHTAKWDRRVARLSLGMSSGTADSIAILTPRQLAVISARHWAALRLRWQNDGDFWARLLAAAQGSEEEALSESHLHAKLLLSATLLAGSTLTKS